MYWIQVWILLNLPMAILIFNAVVICEMFSLLYTFRKMLPLKYHILRPKKIRDMADKQEKDLDQASDCAWVRGLDANGNPIKIKKEDLATVLKGLMPTSYSAWTAGSKLKLTKGSCCFMFASYGSAYIVTCTGSKGASVSKLGGKNNIEFREDSSGNIYAFAIGIYFIQIIGYNSSNIIAEVISAYPPDCTTLVVE